VSKNILLLAAIGGAVLLVLSKQSQAAAPPMTTAQKQAAGLLYTAPQTQSANMNGDMWTRLLGDGWRNLTAAQNSDGTAAFLKKNIFGQVTTGDGKPVSGGDPLAAYTQVLAGVPADDGTNYLASVSPFSQYIDGGPTSAVMGW
jgi:hypothetical protein